METWSDGPGDDEPVEVPPSLLSPDALRGVVSEFVLREGTDYGARQFSHEEKMDQVLAALDRGEAAIFFDPATSTVTLRLKEQRLLRDR